MWRSQSILTMEITERAVGLDNIRVPWKAILQQPDIYFNVDTSWPDSVAFQDPSKIRFPETKTVFDFWVEKAKNEPRFLIWCAWYDRGAEGKDSSLRTEGLYPVISKDSTNALEDSPMTHKRTKKSKKKNISGSRGLLDSTSHDTDCESVASTSNNNRELAKQPATPAEQPATPTDVSPADKGKKVMRPGYIDEDDFDALLRLEENDGNDSERDWEDYTDEDLHDRVRDRSPAEVATSFKARTVFLQELSHNNVYQAAVTHVSSIHDSTVLNLGYKTIPEIPWATWTLQERSFKFYENKKNNVDDAIEWLMDRRFLEDDHHLNRSGELEQVVFVVGMIFRELHKHQFPHSPTADTSTSETLFGSVFMFMEMERHLEDVLKAVLDCHPSPIIRRAGRLLPRQDYAAIHDGRVAGLTNEVVVEDNSMKPGMCSLTVLSVNSQISL